MNRAAAWSGAWLLVLVGCGQTSEPVVPAEPGSPPVEATPGESMSPREHAVREVKAYVDTHVGYLVDAARGLCAAAPTQAWAEDREALDAMRAAWWQARDAYERIEGAIAVLFPELDLTLDARYEHEVELTRDTDPFDGVGFVGMHAIERLLWADSVTPEVHRFERALGGYRRPEMASDEATAVRFREGLCARLVSDAESMQEALGPLALDHQTAWRGLQGSIEEQAEKVALHATGQDESRYSRRTMADMRANLAGGRAVLAAYEPMLDEHPDAAAPHAAIERGFAELEAAYAEIEGDALPPVPEGFDPDAPSEAHQATPYGRLFGLLSEASDPLAPSTLAHRLREAGDAMGIPALARSSPR